MTVAGERRVEAAHEGHVSMSKFRRFAHSHAFRVRMQGQPTASFAQGVSLFLQTGGQVLPAPGLGKVSCEEHPQGSEKLLIRPIERLRRSAAALYLGPDSLTNNLPKCFVTLLRQTQGAGNHRRGKPEGDVMHIHSAMLTGFG